MDSIRFEKIHQEKASTVLNIDDIETILVEALAKKSGIKVDSNTKKKVKISTRPSPRASGNEYYAEVSITNDIK